MILSNNKPQKIREQELELELLAGWLVEVKFLMGCVRVLLGSGKRVVELQSTFGDLLGGGNSLKGQRTLRRWPFFMVFIFGNGDYYGGGIYGS
ncbi:hypothetical protein CMV_024073 [Castanea mollissima]|uniref:Uncharacterized protein n=1 Tax=Castanea mollissima TaxID=60419 RepID=A0A8J4QG75_9ROSI|nr:hypothetical protein CMV_024073 [Castanea mollissima]